MLAHSRNVLMQQSLQVLLQPILFACQKLSKSIKRLEVADCSTIYGSSQLFNTGSLFLSPSTHRNNRGFYFYLLEILKELCLCLRCWPHPKYVYMHSTQCNTNTTFLDHFNGPSEHSSCKFLLGVFIGCSPSQHCPRSTFGHSSQCCNIPEHSMSEDFNDFPVCSSIF